MYLLQHRFHVFTLETSCERGTCPQFLHRFLPRGTVNSRDCTQSEELENCLQRNIPDNNTTLINEHAHHISRESELHLLCTCPNSNQKVRLTGFGPILGQPLACSIQQHNGMVVNVIVNVNTQLGQFTVFGSPHVLPRCNGAHIINKL